MAIYHENIVSIDLKGGSIHRSFAPVSIGTGDQNANRFGVRVFRNGEPVSLSNVSCQGVFRDPMGNNIALTSHGTVEGNVAYLTLPQACYNYEGQFCLAIKLIGGGVTGTMRIVDGMVDNTHTGGAVAPTSAVPTYQEVLAVYDDAIAAVDDVNVLKSAFVHNEINNNAFDILLPLKKTDNTQNGVTFTWNADGTECTIDTGGSASTGLAVDNIFNVDANTLPAGMEPGRKIRILSLDTDKNVAIQIFISTDGSTFPTTPQRSTKTYSEYSIPSNATGAKIRIAAGSGVTLSNLKIRPQILTETKTNKELEKSYEFTNKGVLPTNTDLNDVKDEGRYFLQSSNTYTNIPSSGVAYTMEVIHTSDNSILQRLTGYGTGKMYIRTSSSGSFSERTWNEIPIMADIIDSLPNKGTIPTNTDIDTIRDTGIWFLTSSYTYTHSPLPAGYGGIMLVFKYSNNSIIQMVSKAGTGEMYIRASLLGNFPETWAMGGTVNNYISEHFENTYNITCEPEITTDTNNFLASTGDNTDRTGDIQTMLNTTGVCHLGPGLFMVTGIEIPDYATLTGSGTHTMLRLAGSVTDGYAIKIKNEGHVSNMRISGGTSTPTLSATVGTRHGILFEGTKRSGQSGGTTYKRSSIDHLWIRYFEGGGITCDGTGVDLDSNMLISDCFVDHCGAGIYIPYYSEFHRIANCAFTYCWYGCVDNGGNNNFANCDFSGNKVGILIDNSSDQSTNNSHGTFSGCSVNHSYSEAGMINEGIAIKLLKSNLGEIFTGMQIFYGAIVIDDCVGIRFVGANVGSKVPITITDSTVVTFSDCTFKEGPTHADSTFTQSNNTVLKFTDCYLRDGTVYNPMSV